MRLARIRAVAAVSFAVALAGCAASKNPIGPENQAVSEPRLAGVWINESDRSSGDYLHILATADDNKRFQVVAVNHGDNAWAVLDGYITAVGDRRFVNLRLVAADTQTMAQIDKDGHKLSHPFTFAAIAFDDDDHLVIANPVELLFAAVKGGRLAGETSGDYDVYIDDSSEKIADVLGSAGSAKLFEESQNDQNSQHPLHYRRVKEAP